MHLPAKIAPPNLTTLQLSSTLWALLADGPSSQVEEIARHPAMRAECERSRRQLSILAEPAGSDAVERALAPLVLVYGLGDQAKAKAFWQVYTEALGDLPRMALDRAAAEYPRIGKFFPKPAEIRELAMPHANALRTAAARAERAVEWQEPKAIPVKDRPSAEDINALMADFHATMQAKDPLLKIAEKRRPPPCARVDETGVSAEMRALLERQREAVQ